MTILFYSLLSIFIVSLASLIGVVFIGIKIGKLKTILIYMVSLSAGALFGDAFIHLLPELIKEGKFTFLSPFYIISGILLFFILEKVVHWRHCHMPITKQHVHPFAYMNLFGDALHNFIDGMIITASYIVSIPVGFATTLAVFFHEIPQEIGDFGVMLHAGFSMKRALLMNFLVALTAILGGLVAFWLNGITKGIEVFLIPLTIGGFIYVAGSDLIPELHKETEVRISFWQIITFIAGVLIMLLLKVFG